MLFRQFALVSALCLASTSVPAAPAPRDAALVLVSGGSPDDLVRVSRALEAAGARLPHRLPPSLLVGSVPPEVEARFTAPEGTSVQVLREGRDLVPGRLDDRLPPAARAARRFLEGPSRLPRTHPLPPDMAGDLVTQDERDLADFVRPKHFTSPECDRPSATSAYLAGTVAIGILLPESTGTENTQDWAIEDPARPGEDRQDLVVAEIMEGCEYLVTQLPEARLTFVYEVHRSIGIPTEPCLHSVGARGVWIQDIMEELAFGGYSETASVGQYLHELRERPGVDADWAVAAFVADNLTHPRDGWGDSDFPFAYALLGGPYLVMNYHNDGFGIANMDAVMKHELAHCFRALDEYASAGNSCENIAGYLQVPNRNNDSTPPCLSDTTCIMRGGTPDPICEWTLGQLGIRDLDGDGIIDPRDFPPDTRLDQESPLLVESADVTLTGLATGLGLEGEGSGAPAWASINRVASGEWRLDGGAWQPLAADDGAFGDRCERLTIALAGLAEGWHDVEARATNDLGALEPSPALVRVYVNTDCADDASEPDDSMAAARPRPARTFNGLVHCAYDQDWSRLHLSDGAALGVQVTFTPGTTLTLDLLDAAGNLVVAGALAGPGDLRLAHVATWERTYFVRVAGESEDETSYSLTLAADCIDDPFEPNATPAAAQLVGLLAIPDLALCPGDTDHFALSLQAGQTFTAAFTHDSALGDLDLEVFDPTGASAGVSSGTGDAESVSVPATLEGVHVVKVHGKTPADTNLYTLDLDATGCLDDLRENDDDTLNARPIAAGAEVRGRLCEGDEDWYSVTVTAVQLVRLQASFDAAAANLDLELRDASGVAVLGRSAGRTGFEDITNERLRPGEYRLRVFASDGRATPYTLTFEQVDPILLFVNKDPLDAILTWTEASQECYLYRRSELPSDFTGAVSAIVQDGDEGVADREYRDRNVIPDGTRLYCYLVSPADCGTSLPGAFKTASPYPVLPPAIGTVPQIEYTITIVNDGTQDAFGLGVFDDVPQAAFAFTVTEIPPGATDSSQPAPAGAFGRGLVQVTGIDVPRGGQARVRFVIQVGRSTTDIPVVDNQGRTQVNSSPVDPGTGVVTDDPATIAFRDDTRVLLAQGDQRAHVHAMWHQEVDLDLRVIDPCGNVISRQDAATATCGGRDINLIRDSSCAAPGFPTRFATVEWTGFGQPPSGTYRVEIGYPGALPDDPDCRGRGAEDVTVAWVPAFGAPQWVTTTVEPGGFVPVLEFTVP